MIIYIYAVLVSYALTGLLLSFSGKDLRGRSLGWQDRMGWQNRIKWAAAWPWGITRLGIYKALKGNG
ncbi:hypothetical protein C7446_2556 [Kushneria sinocarnis]|uniref:Uncharacterized protein n=1 Tax=Kushneria sinocarnis TaxID=595502 RepID=A0A420WUL4_9GAMM|nr:hypothetical protein [Kushneria sinocarnis]RKQ97136.1 hypothetical protein C7446_2556 [Kushneria sinocarnis]